MSEIATKEEMRQRAIQILKSFKNLHPTVLEDFEKEGVLYYSERLSSLFPAALYWVRNEPEYVEIIKRFEEENNAVAFHAILTHTNFGDILDILAVYPYKEDWAYEDSERKEGYVCSYAYNLTDPICSDMGTIKIKEAMGGLMRVL